MNNKQDILKDQEARDIIINDYSNNFLVEASAGSGKTSCLVKRMTSLIKKGIYKVEQIVAITFTRKAAFELKERFQQEIESELKRIEDSDEKNLLFQAIANLEQCYIGTIHSFCARILRERPIEAGLDPTFKEIDEVDNILSMEQSWEKYLFNMKANQAINFQNLSILGIQAQDLKESYKQMCQYPEIEIVHEKIESQGIESTMDKLFSFCEEAEQYIPVHEPERGYDFIQEKILEVQKLKKYPPYMEKDFYKISLIEPFSKDSIKSKIVLNRWLSKEKAKEYRDIVLPELKREYFEPALERWREYCHDYILNFLKPAVEYYHDFKEKYSILNFQDLLLKTANLLRENPDVRQYFQEQFRTILVDEFQDTDPIQAEIIFYLTGKQLHEKEWKKLIPRPGSLFIVGDPQQSIYRFRRADIAIYNQIKRLIADSKGNIVKLTTNFRSLHSIGQYINPLFQDLFNNHSDVFQPAYSPMQTIRQDEEGHNSGVYHYIIDNSGEKSIILENDAKTIAMFIREWVDNKLKIVRTEEELEQGLEPEVNYSDFMILLRYKNGMDTYSKVLNQYNIPVSVSGSASINESIYLRELLKLVRLLKDPDNQILFVAVLRGIFYGISDEELYIYKYTGGNYNIFSDPPVDLETGIRSKFYKILKQLREYFNWSSKYLPSVVLEKIMIETGLLPFLYSDVNGKERFNEFLFILEYLRKSEMRDFCTFSGMIELLERLWGSGLEEEFNLEAKPNTVRLMNLHKAKGLEAPIVFLAIPFQNKKPAPAYYIERIGDIPRGHFLVKKYQNFGEGKVIAQPKKWKRYFQIEKSHQDAEETRLLYVAATRAKNMLVMSSFGTDMQCNTKNSWMPLLKNINSSMLIDTVSGKNIKIDVKRSSYIPGEYENQRDRIEQTRNKSLEKSYLDIVASRQLEFQKKEYPNIITVNKGGKNWGNAVHEIMEYIVKEKRSYNSTDQYITYLLKKNGIAIERQGELYEIIQKFLMSNLYHRIENASQVFTEVPFNIKILPSDPLYKEFSLSVRDEDKDKPIVITGIIDLVFKEKGGWVIVDYKTDCPAEKEDYSKLRNFYENQVLTYSKIWQKISKDRVDEEIIYFVSE